MPLAVLRRLTRQHTDYPTPTSSPDRQADGQRPWSQSGINKSPRIPSFNELASFASITQTNTPPPGGSQQLGPVRSRQKFSAAWYLDSVGSKGMEMGAVTDLLWADIATFTVTIEQARLVARRYFETSHSWLPVVSKTRLGRTLEAASAFCGSADFSALIVAMDLLAECDVIAHTSIETHANEEHNPPAEMARGFTHSKGSVYQSLKAVLSACEQKGQLPTNLLAAQVLTAAFELGQGLYPAAYYSVGACVRTCHTLGLHNRRHATQLRANIDTWNETEERRRLWWASIVLDRTVSVGFRQRPLAVPSIPPNEIIPGDDDMWDAGELPVNSVLIMSIESQTKLSPFARTCQAAHLLGRVCDHADEHTDPTDVDFHFQEAFSIYRAGEALLEMIREEMRSNSAGSYKLFSAMGLCCSALLSLYATHSCIEIDPLESSGRNRGVRLEMQQQGIDGYRRISSIVSESAGNVRATPLHNVSPLVLHCLYESGHAFAWIFRENGSESHLASLQEIRGLLKAIEARWAVAGES